MSSWPRATGRGCCSGSASPVVHRRGHPGCLQDSGSTHVARGLARRLQHWLTALASGDASVSRLEAGMAPSSDWVRALWSLFWHKGDSGHCGHLSAGWWPRPLGAMARDPSEVPHRAAVPAPCLAGAPEAAPGGCCCCSGTCQAAGCHRCAAAQCEPASCVLPGSGRLSPAAGSAHCMSTPGAPAGVHLGHGLHLRVESSAQLGVGRVLATCHC